MVKRIITSALTGFVLVAGPPASAFKLNLNKLSDIVQSVTQSGGAFGTVSESKEIELGRGLAARLLGAAPLVDDRELQSYVNRVGLWIALQSSRPRLPWRFGVLDTDTVNAFAVPGGLVFVTEGLFRSLANEAELAGVLAHEISHVTARHHLVAIQKKARTELAVNVLTSLTDKGGALSDALVGVGIGLYGKGLDRGDELDADRMGVMLAARSGYDAYGLPAVLYSLAARDAGDDSLALMMSTHPSPEQRIEALDAILDERFEVVENPRILDGRFLAIQTRLK